METQALVEQAEKQVGSLQLQSAEIRITSQQSYNRAVQLLGTVKSMLAGPEVKELEEAKQSAHDAHLKVTALWHRLIDPLKAMETVLKGKLLAFDRQKQAEEDAKRRKAEEERQAAIRAEQARLQAEAKAKAEREAKIAAEAARKAGESKRAQDQAAKQAATDAQARIAVENAEKIATMEAAPIPDVRPLYKRSAAVQTRDNWVWEFTGATDEQKIKSIYILACHIANNPGDLYLLEPEKLLETHPALNKLAKAQKTMMRLPGGRAVNLGSVAAKAS